MLALALLGPFACIVTHRASAAPNSLARQNCNDGCQPSSQDLGLYIPAECAGEEVDIQLEIEPGLCLFVDPSGECAQQKSCTAHINRTWSNLPPDGEMTFHMQIGEDPPTPYPFPTGTGSGQDTNQRRVDCHGGTFTWDIVSACGSTDTSVGCCTFCAQ